MMSNLPTGRGDGGSEDAVYTSGGELTRFDDGWTVLLDRFSPFKSFGWLFLYHDGGAYKFYLLGYL